MSGLRCLSTESQITSSIVEVGGGDGVKLDQLIVFCLFFPSAQAVKATSRECRLCTVLGKLTLARVSQACWYSSYTDGPLMEAPENSCSAVHLWGSCVTLSIMMCCMKG